MNSARSDCASPSNTSESESPLAQALAEFALLAEQGLAPERAEFIKRYPELAPALDECLKQMDWIASVAKDISLGLSRTDGGLLEATNPTPRLLGDFRILRQIGSGGMGVVYEAEQLLLGRRVALKVLPMAAMLDPRALARFKNEVYAAASLDHPHIVDVFGMGCDRGIHFYAMRYIDGQTLSALITELSRDTTTMQSSIRESESEHTTRLDSTKKGNSIRTTKGILSAEHFRRVVELGIQAAEALDYAHRQGIVHRDIKPSNLLIDAHGKLWVTDFGLAHIESAASMTITGDLVGTLRYMSPEQSLGNPSLVDYRTDIYSLGASLYELATLVPLIPSQGREAILNMISSGNFVAPRRHCRELPPQLEKILLKCVSHDPAKRYATAADLVDDLRRFLDGRDVVAQLPGTREKAIQWCARHKTVTRLSSIFLGILAVSWLLLSLRVWHERNRAIDALNVAKIQTQETRRQRDLAERNFRRAMDGVADLLLTFKQPRPGDDEVATKLEREQIERAVVFLESFVGQRSENRTQRQQGGIALVTSGIILHSYHEYDRSNDQLKRAIVEFETLLTDDPNDVPCRIELAQACNILGKQLSTTGQRADARQYFDRARRSFQKVLELEPENSHALNLMAWFCCMTSDQEFSDYPYAIACAEKAVRQQPNQAAFWNTLGIAYYRHGDYSQALEALGTSVRIGGGDRMDWIPMSMAHKRLGHTVEADRLYRKVLSPHDERGLINEAEVGPFIAELEQLFGSVKNINAETPTVPGPNAGN